MTEVEYVLNHFDEHFAAFQQSRIVLHGSRNYAEAIIQRFWTSYHFIGIMSMDSLEGKSWHGLPIMGEEDLQRDKVDLVILTERVKYEESAFRAIRRRCRKNNIGIYNMYGLDEFSVHYLAGISKPLSLNTALQCCLPYDIIAFEVMDTLFPAVGERTKLQPNTLLSELIPLLRSQGKELRFSLRKSFPEDVQIQALRDYGFVEREKQELIHRTGEDLSFRMLKENAAGKKILYFGQGLVNEFVLPRCYGIDSILFADQNTNAFERLKPNKTILDKTPFSHEQRERIMEQIRRHQVISFDIFDTLLLRKTLFPEDVFELLERKVQAAGYVVEGFASARARIESSHPFFTLNQIYEELAELYCWDRETEQILKEMELDVERGVLEPRSPLIELFYYAQNQGKRVILTSDMYLPDLILLKLLSEKGIHGQERIFVSCDCKSAKHNGLFSQIIELFGKPELILHIGDDPVTDGEKPKALGIDSIVVLSALSLACNRGWNRAVMSASSFQERCLLGLTIYQLFADPFQNPDPWDLSINNRIARLGYNIIGPLIVGHMCWLIKNLKANDYDAVLFLSRDGWLPLELYKRICDRLSLPRGIYYYASRHSVFLCCADSEQQVDYLAETGRILRLDMEQLLEKVYLIPKDEILSRDELRFGELNEEYIEKHMRTIHGIAEESRKGYHHYSESLGMREGGHYALVDFVTIGSIQKYLSQVLPYSFFGFYYGTYSPKNVVVESLDFYLKNYNSDLVSEYVELESIFSSPEPAVDHITEQGSPVFQNEIRSVAALQSLQSTWNAALSFALEYFDLFYQDGEEIASSLIEEMYAVEKSLGLILPAYDDWFQTEIKKRPTA